MTVHDRIVPSALDDAQVRAELVDALARSTDLILLMDETATVVWCNDAIRPLLGYAPVDVTGRSIAEFLHPDDLERAAEVIALTEAGAFDEAPIMPALYRARDSEGRWVDIEVNASALADGTSRMAMIVRPGGDLVLADHLLEAVTAGEPVGHQVDLVLEMGLWRYPDEGYAILFHDEDGRRVACAANLPPELYGMAATAGETPWGLALATGTEVSGSLDVTPAPDLAIGAELAQAARSAGYTGFLASPVPDPSDPGDACIVIWTTAGGPTVSGHRYGMSNMRRAMALVLKNRAQVVLLERAARVDGLTGLTSRARFLEILAQVEADNPEHARHALLYIDLDAFKSVNDSLGHAAGDQFLAEAARRLQEVAPDGAVVARLGGDEFAMLCPTGTDADGLAVLAQRIIERFTVPPSGGEEHPIGVSIGAAVGAPGDGPQQVLHAADLALIDVKASGRGRWAMADRRPDPMLRTARLF